jgi:ribonucleoside-diphosphate reductase alpha chain
MARAASKSARTSERGLAIERRFTQPGVHPFDQLEWEIRDALIGDPESPAFEQGGVEFPKSWSQNATNIVAQKYFRGQLGSPERETSVKQMVSRVAGRIAEAGREAGYFASTEDGDAFEAELSHILVNQTAAFNSPVWFNVGWKPPGQEQASACFILSVEDEMDSILAWNTKEGIIFKGGSGSGINLSKIRGSMEPLSRGGIASGPVSFMRGADSWAGAIKSGGGTRRAAKMVVLDVDHPDIEKFIWCKADEEKKAAALKAADFDMRLDSEAFASVQFQNANNSVRVTDEFMEAVANDEDWELVARTDGSVIRTVKARELMEQIADAAWQCADPGVQYHSTINRWHTDPNTGPITASNPCFPGDARVHTTEGLLPIGELYERAQSGEYVAVYTHRRTAGENDSPPRTKRDGVVASTPLQVMQTGVKPVVRLRFSSGATLRCTPNHRIWTLNRGYVAAEELTKSDQVMLNDSPTRSEHASWELPVKVEAMAVSRRRGSTAVHRELPTSWSESLGELTGHLVGDGCLTDAQTQWIYGGDDIDDGLTDWHEHKLTELIGGISRQEMDNGTVQLRAGSSAVRQLFRGIGVTSARAHEKRVPESIFKAPQEIQAAFLRGFYGADGCVSRVEAGGKANRYVGLGSRSEALLKDVQRIFNAFGIRGRIYRISESAAPSFTYTRKDGSVIEYESRQGFDLRVTGSDLVRFANEIGFSAPRKTAALEAMLSETTRYETKSATKLVAREEDGQEIVYNLTEPLHHSYIVDGFVVANCSEYMSIDDSACNLASLNLMKFRNEDGTFNVDDFTHAVDIVILAQEILVGFSSYPTEQITKNARAFRQLGLGYANLGALLMAEGLPYDSDAGRAMAGAITALMTGRGYRKSAEVAAAVGPYDGYAENREPHNEVMRMHQAEAYKLDDELVEEGLLHAARGSWDEAVALGEQHGYRNAQATVLAPTGTISFLMDCDTTGIEPDFSLVKFKELVGGGQMKIVNRSVNLALETLRYSPSEIEQIDAYINEHNTIIGAPGLKDEHLAVFDVAVGERSISPTGHIEMMAAAQPFISGAISKTVNLPETATVEDIADAYTYGWRKGLKALAIYRDGSKTAQALRTKGSEKKAEPVAESLEGGPAEPVRRKMPRERESITHKFRIGMHEGYITAGKYEDGSLGEIFLTDIGKEGSTLRGMMNAFATAVSIGLQYGVPLEVFVKKFSYMRFDPEGITTNPEIPFAKSMPDYIMRWLASRFMEDVDYLAQLGILTDEVRARKEAQQAFPIEEGNGGGNGHAKGEGNGSGSANGEAKSDQPKASEEADGGSAEPQAESKPAAAALTDAPPVHPAAIEGLELGPACDQCGGMMQRTGSCYTCSSCGNNTGCG